MRHPRLENTAGVALSLVHQPGPTELVRHRSSVAKQPASKSVVHVVHVHGGRDRLLLFPRGVVPLGQGAPEKHEEFLVIVIHRSIHGTHKLAQVAQVAQAAQAGEEEE